MTSLSTVLVLAVGIAWAARGSSAPSTSTAPAKTPQQEANDHYNYGLTHRDKAWKLEKKLDAAENEKQRQKLEQKIAKRYKRAIEEFTAATRKNSQMFQAYSSLGYALRKTGRFDQSLSAYDRALAISPGYAEAIEYRAEAYLGLNEVEQAKKAYIELMGSDRARADELLEAMKGWIARQRADPGTVDAETVDGFAGWVEEREEIASQTTTVSGLKEHGW
jgi:tetratricopeptide (TPR) repeat protein